MSAFMESEGVLRTNEIAQEEKTRRMNGPWQNWDDMFDRSMILLHSSVQICIAMAALREKDGSLMTITYR